MIIPKNLSLFEKKIGYNFKNKNILSQCLTHPSYLKERGAFKKKYNQFERLEFLGDRVLGLIISSLLFKKYFELDEGDLSKKFSYLVQKKFLYKIALDLSLDKTLLYNFKNKNKKMTSSILSDSVESLIGGIYIDSGFKNAFNFVNKFWSPYLGINITNTADPKTTLQEISQQKLKLLPEYQLEKKEGPSHLPIFTVSLKVLDLKKITAKGSSIREAETKAASLALKKIYEKKTT